MTTIPLCPSMKSMMNISKSLIAINPLLSPLWGDLFKLEKTIRAVIKRRGLGIPPATLNMAPGYFQRKIEEKLIPTYLLYLPGNLKS